MSKEIKMQMEIRKVSFAEAEEIDVAYYASVDWKESVETVESLRKGIWQEEYKNHNEIEKIIHKRALTESEDEFE